MLLADDARRCQDANPAACSLLGLSKAELLELRIDDLAATDQRPNLDAMWKAFLEEGAQHGRFELQTPGGKCLSVSYSATANILPGLHLSILLSPDAEEPGIDDGEAVESSGNAGEAPDSGQLTPREREVVTMLALGRSGAEIAAELKLSRETVKAHVRNARQRLGARTRAQLVALALQTAEIDVLGSNK